MKKNITINLFGSLYCIDEDAYILLQKYTESMKSYFARQEGGEEIADDIEHRVAELMWQKKEEGFEAITIDMIKEIISKIGNPAEIDGKDEEEPKKESFDSKYGGNKTNVNNPADDQKTTDGRQTGTTAENTTWAHIKDRVQHGHLYRNPRDKKLGGVCSGLASYFNKGVDTGVNDVTWWRLGFLLAAMGLLFYTPYWMPDITPVIVPIFYVLLWIIMPEAHTAEDRLRMKGKEVNPESINEEILKDTTETQTYSQASYQAQQNSNSGCLKVLLALILFPILFPFLILIFVAIIGFIALSFIGTDLFADLITSTPAEGILQSSLMSLQTMGVITLISLIGLLAITLYFIIRWIRSSDKKLSAGTIVTLVILWILCIGFAIFGSISTAAKIGNDAFFNITTHQSSFSISDDDDWSDDDDSDCNDDDDSDCNDDNDSDGIKQDTVVIPNDTIKAKIKKEVNQTADKIFEVKEINDSLKSAK